MVRPCGDRAMEHTILIIVEIFVFVVVNLLGCAAMVLPDEHTILMFVLRGPTHRTHGSVSVKRC